MSDTRPGADELRVRGILRARGVGPDATPPPVPPKPTAPPRDWLDDILDSNATATPPPASASTRPATDPKPTPDADRAPKRPTWKTLRGRVQTGTERGSASGRHPATVLPRASLLDALDAVAPRNRRLVANVSAAGLSWSFGAVDFVQDVVAWVHAHGPADPQSIFWVLVGVACLALYRRSRGWWWPVAWLASVPAATAVAGVLLYAPTA